MRPVERVFIGDPDVSEAIYRLLKAAREGRRLQEEVRVAGPRAGRRAGCACGCARSASRRATGMTVWSLADVTRERERQENVFQELQHAIDYLDHAPAGFFSVDAKGDIGLSQRHARQLARSGSGAGRLRRTEARRTRGRRRRGAADDAARGARRGQDRGARPRSEDPQRPHAAGAAVPQGRVRRRRRARRLAHAGAQPRARRRHRSAARRPKCASCASSTTRRWRSRPSTSDGRIVRTNALFARLFHKVLKQRRRPTAARSCAVVAERDRPALEAAIAPGRRRQGRHRAGRCRARRRRRALRPLLRHRGRGAGARPGGGDRLRARDHRAARAREQGHPAAEDGARSASSPAASPTTSTTCSPPS